MIKLRFAKKTLLLSRNDASVKSTLPTRFCGVGGAATRADSRFLQRFSDFWRLHQESGFGDFTANFWFGWCFNRGSGSDCA